MSLAYYIQPTKDFAACIFVSESLKTHSFNVADIQNIYCVSVYAHVHTYTLTHKKHKVYLYEGVLNLM